MHPTCNAPASARMASQAPATARVGIFGGGPQPRSVTIVSTTFWALRIASRQHCSQLTQVAHSKTR